MDEPIIKKENIKTIYDNKYLKMYSLEYGNGVFYLEASRRNLDDLLILKSEEEYNCMLPDAVTCILVLKTPGKEPRLYFEHEFRYPVKHFLLSPPAGLIDKEDAKKGDAIIIAAKREIKEETGIEVKDTDIVRVISPMFFSSPGMTDESNALVFAEVSLSDLSSLNNDGIEGSECIDGYTLLTKEEAKKLIENGKDANGHYYSIYTWSALLYFVSQY